jgi:hypothetical protein|eukprot:COSAG06_NODE_3429_length_5357_cov_51.676996_4_plen_360_part_00
MQRNLKRMFAEAPPAAEPDKRPRRQEGPAGGSDAAAAAIAGPPGSPAGAAAATTTAAPPRSPAQLDTDALLRATHGPSVAERFEAAEARRASTAPTLLKDGQLRVGGVVVARLMDKQTWKQVAAERSDGDRFFWQRAVPCQERPWDDKFPELQRMMRLLLETGSTGDASDTDFSDRNSWERFGLGGVISGRGGHCMCTERVKHLHLVRHKQSRTLVAVGSQCVRRFIGEAAGKEAVRAESKAEWQEKASAGTSKITSFLSPAAPSPSSSSSASSSSSSQEEADSTGAAAAAASAVAKVGSGSGVRGLVNHRPKTCEDLSAAETYRVRWDDDESREDEWLPRAQVRRKRNGFLARAIFNT